MQNSFVDFPSEIGDRGPDMWLSGITWYRRGIHDFVSDVLYELRSKDNSTWLPAIVKI